MTLHVSEFIGRSIRHVLPAGFKLIRDCGLLATAHKQARLAAAWAMPEPQAPAIEAAHAFLASVTSHDPSCYAHRHWRLVADLRPALLCRDGPPMTSAADLSHMSVTNQ